MALSVNSMERKFTFERPDGTAMSLPDVAPDKTPEEVLNHYSAHYPELTSAVVEPVLNSAFVEYKFISKIGTKG